MNFRYPLAMLVQTEVASWQTVLPILVDLLRNSTFGCTMEACQCLFHVSDVPTYIKGEVYR